MAKSRRRSYPKAGQRTLSPVLGHTVGQLRYDRDYQDTPSGVFWPSPVKKPVRPLIRTVLEISSTSAPRRGKRASPLLQARATGRSSDVKTRSPFLNATMVTPQLTQRALECARRNIRREVLFANRGTGKGARSPKRNFSKVKC